MMPSTRRSSSARISRSSSSGSSPEFMNISRDPFSAAARCAPRMVSPAYGVAPTASLTNPNVWVRCSRRPCANRFGRYDKLGRRYLHPIPGLRS